MTVHFVSLLEVAPRAGAWIETPIDISDMREAFVAPRAGAWIETKSGRELSNELDVAPRAGAWIETNNLSQILNSDKSRPARARGLKRFTRPLVFKALRRAPRGRVD